VAAIRTPSCRGCSDAVGDLFLGVLVDQLHAGAEFYGVAGQFGRVDDVGAGQLVLKVGDAGLVQALLLLGGVVFGVFRQVAVRARLGNRLDDAGALAALEPLQLGLERGKPFHRHRNFVLCHVSPRPEPPADAELERRRPAARSGGESYRRRSSTLSPSDFASAGLISCTIRLSPRAVWGYRK
jgi:hypothetical protein